MSENIGYEEGIQKDAPPVKDSEVKRLRDESVKKLEKAQIDKQVRAEAGLTDIPKEPESIPKELPKIFFKLGAKVIKCDKFALDDEEAKVLAKHLSILVGGLSSKWYSAIIVVIVVISKVADCWEKVSNLLGRKKEDKTETPKEEMKEMGRPDIL